MILRYRLQYLKKRKNLYRLLIFICISVALLIFLHSETFNISSNGMRKEMVRQTIRQPISPWGYNKERNVERMTAIQASITQDLESGRVSTLLPFTVVDYGSDEGYFAINTALIFPNAKVMSVDMGGVGGTIWKKGRDVLDIQEKKIQTFKIEEQVQICQTMIKPEYFLGLRKSALASDYQYVLSVFHWFSLEDKESFQKALVDLLQNANVATFIELPVLGDDSDLIRKQVGYKNFKKWYEGTDGDIIKVIEEAARVHHLSVSVHMIAKVPWIRWHRIVYRVEILDSKSQRRPFGCSARRAIYGCRERALFNKCLSKEE